MKVILKSSYTTSLEHALNNVDYISTRDGVVEDKNAVTSNQKNYIKALEKELNIDEIKGIESKDIYLNNPSKKNASIYLSELEDLFNNSKVDAVTNLEYISERPGSAGLFNKDGTCSLLDAKQMFLEHSNNFDDAKFFMNIISLKGEDATRTGYDNLEQWQTLVNKVMPVFANKMGIDLKNLEWFCAMHEHKNPHVHISLYDKSNKGFLKKKDIKHLRKVIAKEVYQDEMKEKANEFYNQKEVFVKKFEDIDNFKFDEKDITLLKNASDLIYESSGKKHYEYLDKTTKEMINKVVKNCVFKDKINKEMFENVLKASKDYTSFYSKDDYFANTIFNPGKYDKKVIQNNIIKALEENYDVINNIYNSDEMVFYREKPAVIKTFKKKNNLKDKIMEDIKKSINFENISLKEKGLIYRFGYSKGIRKHFFEDLLSEKDFNIYLKYESFLNKKVFHEIISDDEYVEINEILGYETREIKKNDIDLIFEKYSDEIAFSIEDNDIDTLYFESGENRYDVINENKRDKINNIVKKFFENNHDADELLNKHIEQKCKILFLNQDKENESFIPKFEDFENEYYDNLKNDFLNGENIKKIHQFIFTLLKTDTFTSKIDESQINDIKKWSYIFLKSKEINFREMIRNNDLTKYDVISKSKAIIKALDIAGETESTIRNILKEVLESNEDTVKYFSEEIIEKSFELARTEKVSMTRQEKPLFLNKREREMLSISSKDTFDKQLKIDLMSINYEELTLKEKGLFFRFGYSKGLRGHFFKNILNENDLSKYLKYEKYLKNKDFHDVISDSDYMKINELVGYETREIKKSDIDKIFDKFAKQISNEVMYIGNANAFFSDKTLKYDDLTDTYKNIINKVVTNFFENNEDAKSMLEEYVSKKTKLAFFNQEKDSDFIENYSDFNNENYEKIKNDFLTGNDTKKIHQFVYSNLKANKKEINQLFINKQKDELLRWSNNFLEKKKIDFTKELYSDELTKSDVICKTKTIAKALIIGETERSDVIETLKAVLNDNDNTKDYYVDEIINKAMDKLASEKIISDANDNPFLLSKKEVEFLSVASGEEINTKVNNFKGLNIAIGVLRLMSSLAQEDEPSNNKQNRKKDKGLDTDAKSLSY